MPSCMQHHGYKTIVDDNEEDEDDDSDSNEGGDDDDADCYSNADVKGADV